MNLSDAYYLRLWQREEKIPDALLQLALLLSAGERETAAEEVLERLRLFLRDGARYFSGNKSRYPGCRDLLLSTFARGDTSLPLPVLFQTAAESSALLFRGICSSTRRREAERMVRMYGEAHERVLAFHEEDYPLKLRELAHRAPPLLFLRGKGTSDVFSGKEKIGLTIVGSRCNSMYGERVTERFVRALSPYPVVIISGLAKGMDAAAHRSALACGLPTIAVLPTPLHDCYPKEHRDLRREIEESGCSISEYLPETRLRRYRFLERNRLLSGLADLVLVAEAGLHSGALITASHAADQGREVLAVPGNIDARQSMGSNQLLEEGADFCISSEVLLSRMRDAARRRALPFEKTNQRRKAGGECAGDRRRGERGLGMTSEDGENEEPTRFSRKQKILMEELSACPQSDRELCLRTGFGNAEVRALITELELKELVVRENGRYVLTKRGATWV